jgi:hypothetical protein
MGVTHLSEDLWVFPPNRHSAGGSAWLFRSSYNQSILVDVPLLDQSNQKFLQNQPPGWIVLTHREGHGQCQRWQEFLGWPVLVQEQEAYLLPTLQNRHSFNIDHCIEPGLNLLWTPGPSPGSCVLHWKQANSDLLFCGRLLWPTIGGGVMLRNGISNFHWPRLQKSAAKLSDWLGPDSPAQIACAAGLGALRGAKLVEDGARALQLKTIANAGN